MSLDGVRSNETEALDLTGQYNSEALLNAPPQTETYQRKITEIIELALLDPTYKLKLKYV